MASDIRVQEITATELKNRLDSGRVPIIIDVREPHEVQIAKLPETAGQVHIPIGDFATRAPELDKHKDAEIVVYCRSGARSEMATKYLVEHGFKSAFNLKGGILAWSRDVDSSVPSY